MTASTQSPPVGRTLDGSVETVSPSSLAARPRRVSWRLLFGLGLAGAAGTALSVASVRGLALPAGLMRSRPTVNGTAEVARLKLPLTVTALGDIESSKNIDVACEVEGQTSILFIKPEGSPVKKGELVCELESSSFRDALTNQIITTRNADSALQQATKNREVAEYSVQEYIQGTYPQTEQTLRSSIAIAETDLANVQRRVEWSNRMLAIGYVTPSQNRADLLASQRAELSLLQAKTSLRVLQEYSRRKQITNLRASVDKARSEELAAESVARIQKDKEDKLRRQVENCRILAPADGIVVYAKEERSRRGGGGQTPVIEEGASVRERQRIFSLPDITQMRVNLMIDETQVAEVAPGQRARIKVDTLPGKVLDGIVQKVRPLSDSRMLAETDIRAYPTLVSIENPPAGLRPGMTGTVEILIRQSEDVLAIPVNSVLQYRGRSTVFVLTPKGPTSRKIELGTANGKLIEVREGLRAGEIVALNPESLMTEQEKAEAFVLGSLEPDPRDNWDDVVVAAPSPGAAPTSPPTP